MINIHREFLFRLISGKTNIDCVGAKDIIAAESMAASMGIVPWWNVASSCEIPEAVAVDSEDIVAVAKERLSFAALIRAEAVRLT